MLLSRAAPLLRRITFQAGRKANSQVTVPVRHSGEVAYRDRPTPTVRMERLADFCGTFVWWWIFWSFYTDYEHVIGEFPYPDSTAWTDEELGVPPDDYNP